MIIIDELRYLVRIMLALGLGFAIGFERKIRNKEAGIRTHTIVSVGSCLFMLISKYGFTDVGETDGARIAAQIVSGIGFLGAGVIMYRRDALCGVTTAAGIWVTAGIGMAAGAGQYILAAGISLLVIFIQWIMYLPIAPFKAKHAYIYRIKYVCTAEGEGNERIKELFGVRWFNRINYYTVEENVHAAAEISTNHSISDEAIKGIIFGNEFVTSVERIFQYDGKE